MSALGAAEVPKWWSGFFCPRGAAVVAALLWCLAYSEMILGAPPCKAFRIHPAVSLHEKALDEENARLGLPEAASERRWLRRISNLPGRKAFAGHYRRWRSSSQGRRKSRQERISLLRCLHGYLASDRDGDGIFDWSAVVNHRLSTMVVPLDRDIDGDGSENVLDPRPLSADQGQDGSAGGFPAHLYQGPIAATDRSQLPRDPGFTKRLADLQEKLYRRTGLAAVNFTDMHSPAALRGLLTIFEHGLPAGAAGLLDELEVVYAFLGHSHGRQAAAYHKSLRALSIAGVRTLPPGELPPDRRLRLLSTLAHEIGHAVVFSLLEPAQLQAAASRFGGWPQPPKSAYREVHSFFARTFFRKSPYFSRSRQLTGRSPGEKPAAWRQKHDLPSHYSLTNVHEWFAEVFASYVLERLGAAEVLGSDWEAKLHRGRGSGSSHGHGGWTRYGTLSPDLTEWIKGRFKN